MYKRQGDRLFLYTDGIPEAMNEKEEEYSDEKMIKYFIEHSDQSSDVFIKSMVNDCLLYTSRCV